MKQVATFLFEGELRTVSQIREIVPVISDSSCRKHLAAGRNTREAMLSFSSHARSKVGGVLAAKRARSNGHEPQCIGRSNFNKRKSAT